MHYEALGRSGIPYKKSSHTPLTDEPAVRALLQGLGAVGPAGGTSLVDELSAAAKRLEQRAIDGIDGTTLAMALPRLRALAESCGNDRAHLFDRDSQSRRLGWSGRAAIAT